LRPVACLPVQVCILSPEPQWPLMACCKCCCGGEDCGEGQQGKCCCGGSEGACCTEEQYCCDGVCESEPCGECSGPCDEENPCPEGCKCCNGECISVDQCCEYTPCECPEGRVPAPTLSGDVYGCCPPELPFDSEGFCCADPADVDTCNYDIAGPFYVCPEGCGCREGVQEDVENGMDPAFIGLSVCVPVNENPLP
jgi:hypothetical protein